MVQILYGDAEGLWPIDRSSERLTRRFGIESQQVKPHTAYLEPAAYLTKEKFCNPGETIDLKPVDLKERNPALDYFADGIQAYFDVWLHGDKPDRENEIKELFVRSVFSGAYESLPRAMSKADRFLSGDFDTQTALAKEVSGIVSSYTGADKNSVDPDNTYNRALVIGWSGFVLASHEQRLESWKYKEIKNGPEVMLAYDEFESPPAKIVKYAVRGKPNYFS